MGMITKLAEIFNVKLSDIVDDMPSNALRAVPARGVMVPLYGRICAGHGKETWVLEDEVETLASIAEDKPWLFWLEVGGDSMDMIVKDGGRVLIDCQSEAHNGDVVAVNINGYDAVLRRFVKSGSNILLSPDSSNGTYDVKVIDENDPEATEFRILGKMIAIGYPEGYRF